MTILILLAAVFFGVSGAYARQSQASGEIRFSLNSEDERDAGIWIDGKYAGYIRELTGKKKLMLPAGDHQISIRHDGYQDLTKTVTVVAGQMQMISVSLVANPSAIYPGADRAELRLDIRPKNAAVYVDNLYVGHGGDFGGRFHSLYVSPAKHQLKVTASGYRTYEMEINPPANLKTEMKIALEAGADPQP